MRVIFGRGDQTPPPQFSGSEWIDAAEAWAEERGVRIAQRMVDQRFRVGQQWYVVAWRDGEGGQLGTWEISPV